MSEVKRYKLFQDVCYDDGAFVIPAGQVMVREADYETLRDERDRLREALEEIARDIAGSPKRKLMLADDNFWATPGEHTLRQWIARAALTPAGGGQDE